MANLNKVIELGNLTRDPEIRSTPNNTAVCKITIAVNRRYTVGDEKKEETSFIPVVIWGKLAEFVSKYFTKGQSIFVEGRLQSRSYDDNDGKKVYVLEVVAENVQFAGPKKESKPEQGSFNEFEARDNEVCPF